MAASLAAVILENEGVASGGSRRVLGELDSFALVVRHHPFAGGTLTIIIYCISHRIYCRYARR